MKGLVYIKIEPAEPYFRAGIDLNSAIFGLKNKIQ
jgi:hypothetical protein